MTEPTTTAPELQPWQRPPFAAGNTLAVKSGAYSPRLLVPLADQLREQLLSDDSLAYLREPWAAGSVERHSMTRAILRMGVDWLCEIQVALAAPDLTAKARAKLERDRQSAVNLIDRFTARADNQAHRLGLDALSRAEIARALAPKLDLAREWMEMDDEDASSTVDGEVDDAG